MVSVLQYWIPGCSRIGLYGGSSAVQMYRWKGGAEVERGGRAGGAGILWLLSDKVIKMGDEEWDAFFSQLPLVSHAAPLQWREPAPGPLRDWLQQQRGLCALGVWPPKHVTFPLPSHLLRNDWRSSCRHRLLGVRCGRVMESSMSVLQIRHLSQPFSEKRKKHAASPQTFQGIHLLRIAVQQVNGRRQSFKGSAAFRCSCCLAVLVDDVFCCWSRPFACVGHHSYPPCGKCDAWHFCPPPLPRGGHGPNCASHIFT